MDSSEFEVATLVPEANGHSGDDLANGAAPVDLENGGVLVPKGLYLVRIPKPPIDDSHGELKKLQVDFQEQVTKLKAMNTKLQAKREVVRSFKRQMAEARGLKETSEPEFQDKSSRMQELRNLRSTYIERIKGIKDNLQGLDCKSEQELDEKIRQLEHRQSHEAMPLREEKQIVQQIARLNAMRGRIKEYDLHKTELVELESEVTKIKAIIGDMDGEFSVIKSERDATKKVVQDIYGNLKKAADELMVLEAEHAELVAAKEAAIKALDSTRDETNASMRDYRENRKFSLTVRDLVAAGQTEEAAAMVRDQVEEWVGKLSTDTTYRKEYLDLMAAQRRFPVSELLPQSCSAVPDARGNGRDARGGPGGRGGAARAPPPEPRGAEKAKSIIEQLMQEASKEAAAYKARAALMGGSGDDADEEDDAPAAVAVAAVKKPDAYKPPAAGNAPGVTNSTGAARLVQDPAAAAAAAFNFKVELPKVPAEVAFVPPVMLREEQSKEALREEQVRKAAEAEERKRKRAEQAERKKVQAAESAKRLEAERKERDLATRAEAARSKAAAAAAQAAEPLQAEEAAAVAETAPTAQQQVVQKMSAPTAFEKRQMLAAAKRPKQRNTPVRQAQSFWNQYQGPIIFAIVMLICIILGIMFLL